MDTIIHFGESLDPEILHKAVVKSREGDLAIVLGTSMRVSPACNLPEAVYGAWEVCLACTRTSVRLHVCLVAARASHTHTRIQTHAIHTRTHSLTHSHSHIQKHTLTLHAHTLTYTYTHIRRERWTDGDCEPTKDTV